MDRLTTSQPGLRVPGATRLWFPVPRRNLIVNSDLANSPWCCKRRVTLSFGIYRMINISCSLGAEKDQLIVSLSALLCLDAEVEATTENLQAAIDASGNSIAPYYATIFASCIEKAGIHPIDHISVD